jgi:N-acetylglutamate synthase
VRPFRPGDYAAASRLWRRTVGVVGGDDRRTITRLLGKNPGTCLVAMEGKRLAGTIMGTHDMRRAYIFHLAVDTDFRRRGIATVLVRACLKGLRKAGVWRVYIFVGKRNRASNTFWKRAGWRTFDDIFIYSRGLR